MDKKKIKRNIFRVIKFRASNDFETLCLADIRYLKRFINGKVRSKSLKVFVLTSIVLSFIVYYILKSIPSIYLLLNTESSLILFSIGIASLLSILITFFVRTRILSYELETFLDILDRIEKRLNDYELKTGIKNPAVSFLPKSIKVSILPKNVEKIAKKVLNDLK